MMRYRLLPAPGLAAVAALISPALTAGAPALPSFAPAYLTTGSFVLTLGALAGLLVANRALRRELDRRGVERQREHNSRVQVEQQLHLMREALERETLSKRDELGSVQQQLDLARAQLEAAESRLNRLARIDDVTGLANRRRFDEALDQEIKRTIREKANLSLVICEIDFYEEYARRRDDGRNDDTLRKLGQAVEEVFRRAGDLVARYGTSKLGIILPATDAEASTRFGERARRRVWDLCIPHEASTAAERMTISVGVATLLPSKLHPVSDLITAAENALLRAHEAGHNRVEHTVLS
jgi:diguanylate cyclase (GGDEF)-like protein